MYIFRFLSSGCLFFVLSLSSSVCIAAEKFSDIALSCFERNENCELFDRFLHDNRKKFAGLTTDCLREVIRTGANSPAVSESCLYGSIWEGDAYQGISLHSDDGPGSAAEALCMYGEGKVNKTFVSRACFIAGYFITHSNAEKHLKEAQTVKENNLCFKNCALNFFDFMEHSDKERHALPVDSDYVSDAVYESCISVRDDLNISSEKEIDAGIKLKSEALRTVLNGIEKVLNGFTNPKEKEDYYKVHRFEIEIYNEYLNNTDKRKQELLRNLEGQKNYEDITF